MSGKILFLSIIILFLTGLNSPLAFAQPLPDNQNLVVTAKLDSLLNYFYDNNKFMGTVVISKGGKPVYEKTGGFIKISDKDKQPANRNTKYRIGSITKMFTAVMIFQLIDEKKLSLDDTLAKFFPEIPSANGITINNLLNHHSGLFNLTNDSTYKLWYTKPASQKQILEIIKNEKPDFQPGEKAEYSNTNYIILGYIIENISGSSYAAELKKRITEKIGLENTFYGYKIDLKNNQAYSYTSFNNKWIESKETDLSVPGGGGAIVSTPGDLTKFIYSLFTGRLISKEAFDKMVELKDNFGRGIFPMSFYDKQGYGHTGGIDGFASNLGYFPGDSVALAYCSNGVNMNLNEILKGILSCYYDKPYTFPSFKTINIPVKQLGKYEGVYSSIVLNMNITIKREGNNLMAQATNQSAFPISPASETQFKFDPAGITIDFTITKAGKVDEFYLKQGTGRFLFSRVNNSIGK